MLVEYPFPEIGYKFLSIGNEILIGDQVLSFNGKWELANSAHFHKSVGSSVATTKLFRRKEVLGSIQAEFYDVLNKILVENKAEEIDSQRLEQLRSLLLAPI